MQTLVLKVQYDGSNYCGWQYQKNHLSVQEVLESALFCIFGTKYSVIAAGRTDSGVHAVGQVVSIPLNEQIKIPENKILYAINSKLPPDIRVSFTKIIDKKFHARFDAIARQYEYYMTLKYCVFNRNIVSFIRYPLDKSVLFKSADYFVRKADFTSFSKHNPDINNPVCNVEVCKWYEINEHDFKLTIKSNHFLYGMVRSIVGFMIDVSRGKKCYDDIEKAFQTTDRGLNSPLAPPQGLFLQKVTYPEFFGI